MWCDTGLKSLIGSWKYIKNCSQKQVRFCNAYEYWESDVFDLFGDHWSTKDGLLLEEIEGKFSMKSNIVFSMCQAYSD
jgi:hypothetical protein